MKLVLSAVLASALAVAAPAASPVSDPLLQKVVAVARSRPASATSFDRSSRTTDKEAGGKIATAARVDRWDGRQMTRISVDGKPASAEDVAAARKASAGRPVPGYHRVADYLAAGARRTAETAGQIVYRVDRLPKGSVEISGDRSDKFVGDATIDTTGAQPFVSRMHFFLPKPLSIMMVAKLDRFDVVNDYRIGPDGHPVLVRSVQSMAGSQFGTVGESRTESSYSPIR